MKMRGLRIRDKTIEACHATITFTTTQRSTTLTMVPFLTTDTQSTGNIPNSAESEVGNFNAMTDAIIHGAVEEHDDYADKNGENFLYDMNIPHPDSANPSLPFENKFPDVSYKTTMLQTTWPEFDELMQEFVQFPQKYVVLKLESSNVRRHHKFNNKDPNAMPLPS